MITNANTQADPVEEPLADTPDTPIEVHLPSEDLPSGLLPSLPEIDYRAVRRLALVLIDIARNPATRQDENTDSKN